MPSTSCAPGSRRTGTPTSPSASGGSASGSPAGRRRRCPTNAYGRGLSRNDAVAVPERDRRLRRARRARRASACCSPRPPSPPTAPQEQIDLYVRDIVTGAEGVVPALQRARRRLRPRRPAPAAVEDGDEWIVNGQKVWTSLRPARPTSACSSPAPTPTCPKHQGITWFAFDMHQPGVEVRPLREMTGHAMFNEVFLSDARVPDDAHHRRPEQRLGGGQHHADARAGRPRRRRRSAAPVLGRRPARSPASSTSGPATSSGRKAAAAGGGRPARWRRRRQAADPTWPRATASRRPDRSARTSCALHTLGEIGRFNSLRLQGGARRPAATSPAWPTSPSWR